MTIAHFTPLGPGCTRMPSSLSISPIEPLPPPRRKHSPSSRPWSANSASSDPDLEWDDDDDENNSEEPTGVAQFKSILRAVPQKLLSCGFVGGFLLLPCLRGHGCCWAVPLLPHFKVANTMCIALIFFCIKESPFSNSKHEKVYTQDISFSGIWSRLESMQACCEFNETLEQKSWLYIYFWIMFLAHKERFVAPSLKH